MYSKQPMWISCRDTESEKSYVPIAFVKTFRTAKAGKFTFTCCGYLYYRIWINGTALNGAVMRSFPDSLYADTSDVTGLICDGENHIAVLLIPHNGTCARGIPCRSGFICKISGNGSDIVTDSSWLSCKADWMRCGNLTTSSSLFCQEHVNQADEPRDWRLGENLDGFAESVILGQEGTANPFVICGERPVKQLMENRYTAPLVWRGKDDRSMRDYTENLAVSFNSSEISGDNCRSADTVFEASERIDYIYEKVFRRADVRQEKITDVIT